MPLQSSNTSPRVRAKLEKRPAPEDLPRTPDSRYVTRLKTGPDTYIYFYTKYSPFLPSNPPPFIMRALQVHGRARMLFSHRPWLRIYHGPVDDGKCAATRALNAHLPAQIRAIHKEWRHTPVGYRAKSQQNPRCPSSNIIYQYKKDAIWAEAMLLSQHWWDSKENPLEAKTKKAPK